MQTNALALIAQSLVSGGRGIISIDEPICAGSQRFVRFGISPEAEQRRAYRELVVTTPAIERYAGGMVFDREGLMQRTSDGRRFVEILAERGIAAGILLDESSPLAFSPGEELVAELDGLRERLGDALRDCVAHGARFACARAGFAVGDGEPTIRRTARALAQTAVLCQRSGLVAIVEPVVSLDGDHDIERCTQTTEHVLRAVVAALGDAGASFDAIVVQSNMVAPGRTALREVTTAEVVSATLRVLGDTIPVSVAGIAFVPDGPDERIATERLCAMNHTMPRRRPWPLTFTYGAALQQAVLAAWRGRNDNVTEAQRILSHRAYCSGLAACGAYSQKIEAQLRTFTIPAAA